MGTDRREFLSGIGSLMLAHERLGNSAGPTGELAAVNLRAEGVVNPLGVETTQPVLSWFIASPRSAVLQRAYRIQVAGSAEALQASRADLWDSGKTVSSRSMGIKYQGAALHSRQRCFWRVQVWDNKGAVSAPSAVSWWEMGLLLPYDWTAPWIAAEDQILRDDRMLGLIWVKGVTIAPDYPSRFRLSFSASSSAELTFMIAATGKIDASMDAVPIKLPVTGPFTIGERPTVEVVLTIAPGKHVLAVSVQASNPLLEALLGFPDAEFAPFMRLRTTDGQFVRTNGLSWKCAADSAPDWRSRDFDDRHWQDAIPVNVPRPLSWPKQPAFLLRGAFSVHKPLARVRLYATALGAYELQLNGQRVGDALLTPESTDFRKRALYRVYDVTAQVIEGENVLGAMVGDGWYASYTLAVGRYAWGPPPRRLLTQLELTYSDGSRETVEPGLGWKIARAPIVWSEIYDGEYYDARLKLPDWSTAGFDASQWEAAVPAPSPQIALTAQIDPPIRRTSILTAITVTEPGPGVFVFDFGQNFAGWCRLSLKGPPGTRVEMRFAERLKPSGEVDQTNLRSARATDTYVLDGAADGESFEPHFTYHGFRFVQVSGFPGRPTAENIQGIVVHSDLQQTGKLTVDSSLIQKLWCNTLWSQRSNFVGIPTDCPQRDERLGWLGDANVFWDAAAFNMDVSAFTRRFMADVRDAQADDGAFPDFSPAAFRVPEGVGTNEMKTAASNGQIGASPGWADAGVCLPWMVWWRYGDPGIVDDNWAAMSRYMQFIARSNPDYIWRRNRGADFGDWLALDAKTPGEPTTPKDLIGTAMWAHSANCMMQMAAGTGRTREASAYRALFANLAEAFQSRYVSGDGSVGNGSQTGYILALRYGLISNALRAAAAAKLVANIERRGTLLTTGFLGTPNSLDVLADAGYSRLAYSLLLRTDVPSWGHMVAKGATTIWERWNADDGSQLLNASFNHYALGAICGFLFRRVAAIAPLEPGFRRIEIRPLLDSRVDSGGGEYQSVSGRIATEWRQLESGGFTLNVDIPPNATAAAYLPVSGSMAVRIARCSSSCGYLLKHLRRGRNCAVIELESGSYRIKVG